MPLTDDHFAFDRNPANVAFRFPVVQMGKIRACGDLIYGQGNMACAARTPTKLPNWDHIGAIFPDMAHSGADRPFSTSDRSAAYKNFPLSPDRAAACVVTLRNQAGGKRYGIFLPSGVDLRIKGGRTTLYLFPTDCGHSGQYIPRTPYRQVLRRFRTFGSVVFIRGRPVDFPTVLKADRRYPQGRKDQIVENCDFSRLGRSVSCPIQRNETENRSSPFEETIMDGGDSALFGRRRNPGKGFGLAGRAPFVFPNILFSGVTGGRRRNIYIAWVVRRLASIFYREWMSGASSGGGGWGGASFTIWASTWRRSRPNRI